VRLQLKGSVVGRDHGDVVVVSSLLERVVLEDAGGELEDLLRLLEEGKRSMARLVDDLVTKRPELSRGDVLTAVESLDELGLLLNADAEDSLSEWQRERHARNLAFFGGYASLSRNASDYQRRLMDGHVVILGVGGLGSVCLMCLAGLGVGRMTLVDGDVVELRNLARQFIYDEHDLGRAKVRSAARWVGALDSSIEVRALEQWIRGPEDVAPLLADVDLVILAANEPADRIGIWVNECCVSAGVPYVVGSGGTGREIVYWSVDPGISPCYECAEHGLRGNTVPGSNAERALVAASTRMSRGIGPGASTLGSLVSLEAMRYLTGFAPPAAAGVYRRLDICTASERTVAWERWPDCPVCTRARRRGWRESSRTAARVAMGV
jgi:molybdopterin/thiamine biosynthesis adenylyltransferase